MRWTLELRSPNQGTGTGESWEFRGRDGVLLREALDGVEAFAVEPPVEVYDRRRYGHEVRDGDRWHAAMLLWPENTMQRVNEERFGDRQAEAAWTAEGALALAELLPERMSDLADALRARFAR